MSKTSKEKPKKPRLLQRILLALAVLVLVALYLVGAYYWMAYKVGVAGVPNPSSPYQETLQGQGQGDLTVTVLGDSTAIGAGASTPRQTFPYQVIRDSLLPKYGTIQYINRGVSGYRVRDIVNHQLEAAVQDQPGLVLISIGTNDVTNLTETDQFSASLKTVLDRLTGETQARIVLLGIPAVKSAPLLALPYPQFLDIFTKRLIEGENNLLKAYPSSRVLPVELYNTTGEIFSHQPELFAADGYHPNDQGYAVWAREVEKALGQGL